MICRLGRQYHFFASHRLHTPELSDEENARLFGKCNHPNGHGHTYTVRVLVEGEPDPVTGMIMDLDTLDEEIGAVLDQVAYKHLDRDVPAIAERLSTTEYVVDFLYREIRPRVEPHGVLLARVEVGETRNNSFEAERTS